MKHKKKTVFCLTDMYASIFVIETIFSLLQTHPWTPKEKVKQTNGNATVIAFLCYPLGPEPRSIEKHQLQSLL